MQQAEQMMKEKQKPSKSKRPRGRPVKLVLPAPIPDIPENIARACMIGPPKKEWDYLKPGSKAKKG